MNQVISLTHKAVATNVARRKLSRTHPALVVRQSGWRHLRSHSGQSQGPHLAVLNPGISTCSWGHEVHDRQEIRSRIFQNTTQHHRFDSSFLLTLFNLEAFQRPKRLCNTGVGAQIDFGTPPRGVGKGPPTLALPPGYRRLPLAGQQCPISRARVSAPRERFDIREGSIVSEPGAITKPAV